MAIWNTFTHFARTTLFYLIFGISLLGKLTYFLLRIPSFLTKIPLPSIPHPLLLNVYYLRFKLMLLRNRLTIPRAFVLFNIVVCMCMVTGLLTYLSKDLPSPHQLANRPIQLTTKIYDRHGELLYKIYKQNRTLVSLNKIPPHTILATLAAEDAQFYTHRGFSLKGILRSLIKNTKEKSLTGGSTITQQLVKNTLLTPEKTLTRKLRELVLSIQVERQYSKDQILEMYLNEVSYGNLAYGIQEASRVYFGKEVSELTLSESALLAGLPKSPTRLSPFGTHPEESKQRQEEILNLMVQHQFIKEEDAKAAKGTALVFKNQATEIKAPHFVMYVKQLLVEQYGEELVEQGGLEVYTTLDYEIQKLAETAVKSEVEKLTKLNVTNGSALVIDPNNGEVIAMVGSKDYFDTKIDGNVNVTLRERSPGSSVKPITYAYALSNGFSLASVLADTPTVLSIPGQAPYIPQNYDHNFRGKLSLRSALAESRNIPAIKMAMSMGVNNLIDFGKKMGITSWKDPSRYGPSITLGGGEVKLIDLVTAYATLANKGKRPSIQSIKQVKNSKGNLITKSYCETTLTYAPTIETQAAESPLCNSEQVIDPRIAFLITSILKDNDARSPAFGRASSLVIKDHPEVAVKTGTSNDLRDNLTVGFTKDYVVGVWVGNNNNSQMNRIASGVTGAAPIWNKIMTALVNNQESVEWTIPQGVVQLPICPFTGTLSCGGCPTRLEWFLEENKPLKACSTELVQKIITEKNSKFNN